MTLAIICGVGLMTFYFSGVEDRQHNPNDTPQSFLNQEKIEVPLKRNRQGHYVVSGNINQQEVEFLLDTGATDVVIPEATAKSLGLKYGRRGRAMTANGPITIWQTHIDELKIGDITLHDVDASINPQMEAGSILLGMSALGRIEFVQSDDTLTLRQ